MFSSSVTDRSRSARQAQQQQTIFHADSAFKKLLALRALRIN